MHVKKWTSRGISLVLAVVMLVGMMAVGFSASAAVQKNPPTWNSTATYQQGTEVSYNGMVWRASHYMNAGIVPDGNVPDNTWTPYWIKVGPCPYPADFAGDDGSVKLSEVKMVIKASAGHEFVGFAPAAAVAAHPDLQNPKGLSQFKTPMLKPNTEYVVFLTQCPPWFIGSMNNDCALIKVNENGSVRIEPTGWGYNGLVECDTLNYKINATANGFTIQYVADQQIQEIYAKDMYSDKKFYGNGVDDATLEEWATLGVNVGAGRGTSGKLPEGGARQGFNVNYLEDMVVLIGTPARTVCPMFDQGALDYYAKAKEENDEFMRHFDYPGSEYYLHDVYCQGVWDTMPAAYGWKQDEYTEPGLLVKNKYPQVNGLAYGFAGGGQNPWVLCDYLERNAGYYDAETKQKVEGTNAGKGWYKGYDEVAEVPYLWQPEHGIFLAYENFRSLSARCKYINDEGIAGCIIWELSGDNTNTYPMISHMRQELNPDKKILGYFTNWSVYNQYHQYQKPSDLPLDMLDVVNYSFFQVGGEYERGADDAPENCLNSMDRWADDYTEVDAKEAEGAPNMLLEFAELKQQYPDFKLLVSVGGWTRGDGFNSMVNDASNRATFVNSVKDFLNKYPYFDGIDLDWEYAGNDRLPDFDDPNDLGSPGAPENFSTYTALCKELRTMLDANFPNRNYLTACSPAAPSNAQLQDLESVAEQCTFINIMTYDYHGAFDSTIGYNSPLYSHPETPDEWSTKNTVDFYKTMNVPLSKMNIGTPFYSRGCAGVKADQDGNPQPPLDPTPINPVTPVEAKGITVDPESKTITVGDSFTATATITPANTTDKTVTWSSNNTGVATVDNTGKITGVNPGQATITAKTANGLTDTCIVTVTKKVVNPTGIEVTPPTATLKIGDSITATAVITPSDATETDITWSSGNSAIATVNNNGVITAVRPGNVTITARTENGLTDTCVVTVLPNLATKIEVIPETAVLNIGGSITATAIVTPDDTTDKTVTWTSNNNSVARVNSNGVITAVSAGTAVITAKTTNGLTDTCIVSVLPQYFNVYKFDCDRSYNSLYGLSECSQPFKMVDGKAYIPVRLAGSATGKPTSYDGATDTITMKCDNCDVRFKCGSSIVEYLDKETGNLIWTYDVGAADAPRYIDNRAYLPIRAMALVTGSHMYYVSDSRGEYVVFGATEMTKAEVNAAVDEAAPALSIIKTK